MWHAPCDGPLGLLEAASMAQQENGSDKQHEGGDPVTDEDLDEGEHVDGLVAPVARLVEQLDEVGPPDGERPVVAAREPREQEETEHGVGEPRRLGGRHVTAVLVRPVHVVQLLVTPGPHLRMENYNDDNGDDNDDDADNDDDNNNANNNNNNNRYVNNSK